MGSRWLRWAVVALALLAVYAAAGFWGVPAVLRWQVPRLAAAQLERPASVGEVRFNPFTLRLQLRDLRLADRDGTPLLAVATVDAALDWRSAVRRAWSLRHVHIDAPQARLAIAPDGRFNLGALLDTLRSHRKPQQARDAALPRIVVDDFALTGGRLEWDDRQVDCHAVLAPVELRFARLSTLPDDRDAWQLTADVAGGGRLQWRGEASLAPIRATGEIVLQDLALPTLGAYLKPYARAVVAGGRLSATLPYELAYDAGRLQGRLHGARLALADLAAGHADGQPRFASLREAEAQGIDADLARREAVIASVRLSGGELGLRRDAQGAWDLAQLLVVRTTPTGPSAPSAPWKVAVRKVEAGALALRVVDESVRPAVTLTATGIAGQVRLEAGQTAQALAMTVDGGELQVERLALVQAGRPPLTLEHLGVQQAAIDLARRRVEAARVAVDGGQLRVVRDAQGGIDLLALLPRPTGAPNAPAGPAWSAHARQLALSHLAIDVEDQGSGIRTQLQDVSLRADGAGTDLSRPVHFEAGLRLREGGQLALQGQVVPAARTLDAQVQLRQLAVAQAQPLLARRVRLKLAAGTLSSQGRLEAAWPAGRPPVLRYTGRAELANLRLDELDGTLFARWKTLSAERLAVGTRGLEVPELRVVAPEASLIIENDRSFNAARLLVRQPAQAVPARRVAGDGGEPFAVRIQRVRLQDARLDFLDKSLRPQFGARIYALNGVVTALSSRRDARSQVELEGRVDEAGLARVRGALNPFSPRDSTDLNVVFRNVDMVPASPYTMKFAGYRIAEGRISLDLRYHVRDGRLDGDNKVVIDRLTLGERVDSPDALKLPVELAIALLKDADGRIDLGLPVTGDLNDPKFSYTAILWKAFTNVLARAVAAPFRALAGLFGGSGEKLEAIDFDPGSDRLLPPEREKLRQVAQLLSRRAQLRLSVPGQFSEAADGAALRSLAVRGEVVRRTGQRLEAGESPGPLDVTDRGVRAAVRELYTQRFGAAEWDKAKAAAEAARPRGEASGAGPADVPVWRRVSNFVQGEPQVADAVGFYRGLLRRLEQDQPLTPDALPRLGERRAQAVARALAETGLDGTRVTVAPPAPVQAADGGKAVPLKLELATR
ncbi:MAG: DUF748 domain-containing protein [Ramlibacter sp.]